MAIPKQVAEWFEQERGIRLDTLKAFGVDYANERVHFPYANGVKERPDPTRPLKEGERRFYFDKGKKPTLFRDASPMGKTVFLVEGETDTMRLWQELRDAESSDASVVGIGGINTWSDTSAAMLKDAEQVFAILDNDDDYQVQAQVDAVWRQILLDLRPRVRRLRLPGDVKDVCEFFQSYDLETLRLLAKKGQNVSRFRPLDLSAEPPPPRWLLENLIAMGDVTLFSGIGGLGKSYLTMGLAVATVEGWESFLGHDMKEHGPVLYIDEENPEDVVYSRLKALGLKDISRIRYLWNNSIRLDRNADMLIEEAIEYQPKLVVLDAFSRLHSKEENAMGEMGPILNEAVKPLARETGAAVVVIHHHDKAGTGPRGSTDIPNSVDTVIDAFGTPGTGAFSLRVGKSRRRLGGDDSFIKIETLEGGNVRLVASGHSEPPF